MGYPLEFTFAWGINRLRLLAVWGENLSQKVRAAWPCDSKPSQVPCKGCCTWVLPRFYDCCRIAQVKYVTILCFTPFSWISFLYPFKCTICASSVINFFWFFITVTTPSPQCQGETLLRKGKATEISFSWLLVSLHWGIPITWKALPWPCRTQEDFLSDHCWSLGSSAWKKQNGLWRPGNLCGVLVLYRDDARGIRVTGLTCLPSLCRLSKVEWFIYLCASVTTSVEWAVKHLLHRILVTCVCGRLHGKAHATSHQVHRKCFRVLAFISIASYNPFSKITEY